MSSVPSNLFFKLPPELRNEVYDQILSEYTSLHFDQSSLEGLAELSTICQVSKQMRAETRQLFFQSICLCLDFDNERAIKKCQTWLDIISARARNVLRLFDDLLRKLIDFDQRWVKSNLWQTGQMLRARRWSMLRENNLEESEGRE